jgi:energy-coupling factor transporter ATP-binding protein EcfA2
VKGLRHVFSDGTTGLEEIDLVIRDSEFFLVCGSNGSGKTTLARHLNGLLAPTAGSVRVDGRDAVLPEVRSMVGMVFQDADSQIVGETVAEDVAFGPENQGLRPGEVKERTAAALRAVGLEHLSDRPCHLLSGGEKRLAAIAGVLAMEPRVVVFDEPFANLDYPASCRVLEQILELRRDGRTVVVTTHDVEKVIAHADRAALLDRGRIAAVGGTEQIVPLLKSHGVRPPCSVLYGLGLQSWVIA